MQRELLGLVLIFLSLAAGPAIGVAITLFARRQLRSKRFDRQLPSTSMLEGDTPLPPPPRTPVFAPLKTTGVYTRRGFMPKTAWLDRPTAPELPTETRPETPPGAPDAAWEGREGSFGGAGASGFYGVAEAPSEPSTCDAAASSDSSSSCGGGDASD